MKYTLEQYRAEREKIYDNFDLNYRERQEALDALRLEWYKSLEVGDRASVHLYTDDDPCTIIKKTATTLTVRYDKATRDPNWKPEWIPGGFSAICTNQESQKWIIEEDPNGTTEVFRWSKVNGGYMHNGCRLTPGWYKHYDYNF